MKRQRQQPLIWICFILAVLFLNSNVVTGCRTSNDNENLINNVVQTLSQFGGQNGNNGFGFGKSEDDVDEGEEEEEENNSNKEQTCGNFSIYIKLISLTNK